MEFFDCLARYAKLRPYDSNIYIGGKTNQKQPMLSVVARPPLCSENGWYGANFLNPSRS